VTVSIRVATSPGEAQIAAVENNRLLDFALWRPGAPDGVGDLHRGRIIAQVPAMAGAFVALADAEGFLPDSEGAKGLTAGTVLTVRVTRAAQGSKGPRLSARMGPGDIASAGGCGGGLDSVADGGSAAALARSETPVLLRRGPDPITRLAARYPGAPLVVDDAGVAAGLRLRWAVSVSPVVFDEDVAEAIDALTRPVLELASGARLSIWPTPALVAIDVEAGGALGGAGGARLRHEALNRAILSAMAEQIRLRNLSGGIVVDLAGMSPRKRAVLVPDFVAALASDPLHPKFLGFTALGLAEIVRSRVHPPLHELLTGPQAAGLAALRAIMAEVRLNPRDLPTVRAHPAVVSALYADPVALPDVVRRTGREVRLRSDPSLPGAAWVLEKDRD
jgi:Ribonuclease E/G family